MNSDPQPKKGKVRVYLDIFFFALMIVVLIPQSTGIPLHEWASFIVLLPFFVHLLINWKWIARNSITVFKRKPKSTRFSYFFNWLLYICMLLVTVSGVVISEAVLPLFGLEIAPNAFWTKVHNASASLFMIGLGVHIALHWKWIVGSIKKFNFKADLKHLVLMKGLVLKQPKQLSILLVVSVLFSLLMYVVEYSDWAIDIQQNTPVTGPRNLPDSWIIYVLPLVKVTVLMSVPALITRGIILLKKRVLKTDTNK